MPRDGSNRARRAAATVAVVAAFVLLSPIPASATHTVTWGVKTCDGAKTTFGTVDEPVRFQACITINGQPLAGHTIFAEVQHADGSQETIPLSVGPDGRATFDVVPRGPGMTKVQLCDDDGCVYGNAAIETAQDVEPPQQRPPPEAFSWEFFDPATGETSDEPIFDTTVELILVADGFDIRELLPIRFQVVIDGNLLSEQPAVDPQTQCRGPDACSVTSSIPKPVPGRTVEIIAVGNDGEPLSVCRFETPGPEPVPSTSEPAPQISEPPPTQERPPIVTVPRERPPTCWWCWGIKFLFVATLTCVLLVYVVKETWFDWCLEWFILIFIWIPFLIAGLVFFAPFWWWWMPLVFGWIPVIFIAAWWWGRLQPWWKPGWWFLTFGWIGLIIVGVSVWSPTWWFLLPVFWLPWVFGYLWIRGMRMPWWRPWLVPVFLGYIAWIFLWVGAPLPGWGWIIPLLAAPVIATFMMRGSGGNSGGFSWDYWGPKLCFIVPWVIFPWLAFMNFFYDPWWCGVVIGTFILVELCILFHFVRHHDWFVWWLWWLVLIFLWIPFLLIGLAIWFPWWWWIVLALWIPFIWFAWAWWLAKQTWWRPWFWALAYVWIALVIGSIVLGFNRDSAGTIGPALDWWFMLPVFWLPWVGVYVWWRAIRAPWWLGWFWLPILGFVALFFGWWVWWVPGWWWLFPLLAVPVFVWVSVDRGSFTWIQVRPKICFLSGWVALPALVFAFMLYCPTSAATQEPTTSVPPVMSTTTPSATPTPSQPDVIDETPEEFLPTFLDALIIPDVDFLTARLDPLVFKRYPRNLCRTYTGALDFPEDTTMELLGIQELPSFAYATDGLSRVVDNVVQLQVRQSTGDQSADRNFHVKLRDGVFHWFTDCGEPFANGE